LTTAQVSTTKKKSLKTAQCAFHDLELQGVLKKISKKKLYILSISTHDNDEEDFFKTDLK